jgi:DNA modification methylase
MTKINVSEDDLQKLSECINNQTEIPEDLLVKLSPGFFEKLQREGQFDYQKLNKFKIPTIEYAGKRPESVILAQAAITGGAAPLQIVRSFGETKDNEWRNMIVQGDNLQFLKTCYLNQGPLIKDKVKGKVKLIYIDPPFGTGDEYGGRNGEMSYSAKLMGAEYIEALRERLIYLRELLSNDGSIFVRLDYHFVHYIKIIMDEVFGKNNFRNEIFVNRTSRLKNEGKRYYTSLDSVLFYSKTDIYYFEQQKKEESFEIELTMENGIQNDNIVSFLKNNFKEIDILVRKNKISLKNQKWVEMHASSKKEKNDPIMVFGEKYYPPKKRRWMWKNQDVIRQMEVNNWIRINKKNNLPELKRTWKYFGTDWSDINGYSQMYNYPTENSEELLERIILSASKNNDLILDSFAGSGSTAAVAEKLGRRWIMCDFGKHAIYTMQKRIWNIASSKKLGQDAKKNEKYNQSPQSFSIISAGAYDFSRIMNLRKNKDAYINFVLGLFSIARDEKDYSLKYKLSNIYTEKDNNPVEVYPVWEDDYLREIKIDEDYLKEIIVATGGRLKGDYYIVTPESCTVITDTTLKNSNNEDVNFKLLKFPYKVLEDISRHLQIEEQPSSQEDINKLISSTAFYFNEDIKIEVERLSGEFRILQFKTEILDKSKKRFEGLKGLSMLLIDKNYDGQIFNMNVAIYKKEISEEGVVKIENLTENSYLIAIDKHGNESKITKI